MIRDCFRKYLVWLLPVFFLVPGTAPAETEAPEALVKNVTEEVLSILRQDKDIQSGNRQRAIALIENKVAPHFDFTHMTRLAVGKAWQQADEGQRQALTSEFRTLLVRTYATALTAYRDQSVSFKPADRATGDEITVRSQINKPGSQPIPLDYSLSRSDDGWKVFDVSVANVSLVTNYRSTFASAMESGGLDGLLKSLQEKNRRLQTASPAA
ncbi:MlaC/ttg2D family ABC transporter substrate-binding protein [Propionivibrio sp.]|uniref:MlaC/ttg2D family ABC transporter substrate-binding protein n=1 Tax=Propionivibrio sp. TaxID=2212460 RepID=UPI0039E661AF